jgi:hypothetical protein
LAVTNERYLLLKPTFSKEIYKLLSASIIGERNLSWIADVTLKRGASIMRAMTLTFRDGSSVRVEDSWAPHRRGLSQFVEEALRAKDR